MSLYRELKQRNVLRVAAAYTVAAWLVIQVSETIFPLFGFGDAPTRTVVVVLAIGFVPALVLSWVFEITPEGLKREADVDREHAVAPHGGNRLDRIIIVALGVALTYFAFDKFVLDPQRDIDMAETAARAGAEQARDEVRLELFSNKSIAVLPFANRSEKKGDEYFTDGMHDELLTRLSRISALKVISRTSVMRYRGD
jgi:adenylate cyclase